MRALYWVLAGGALLALALAAFLAGSLGTTSDETIDETALEDAQTVETIKAEPEVFDSPELDTSVAPAFDIVRVSRNGTGVVAGRGLAEQQVELLADGIAVASAIADENGEWVIILSEPLKSGSVELGLRARGVDGQLITSDNVVVLNIPEGGDEGVLAVLSPRSGDGVSRALQVPGETNASTLQLHVDSIDILPDSSALVTGRAMPGDALRIYVNNAYVNEIIADENGNWSISLGALDADAEHELRVDQLAAEEGAVALRIVQPFSRSTQLDTNAAARSVMITRGNNLWAIARTIYGGGELYTLIFEENAAQIRNPDLIYPGQVFNLPPSAGGGATSIE